MCEIILYEDDNGRCEIEKGVMIMSKFKTWKELEKELNYTPEEDEEMKLELELIKTLIEVRKKLT